MNKLLLSFYIFLYSFGISFSQSNLNNLKSEGYNIFKSDYFAISPKFPLSINNELINHQKANNLICSAYNCKKNTDSRDKIVVYDIIIIDHREPSITRDAFLKNYIKNFDSSIKWKYTALCDLKAIEFITFQEDFTIKSIVTYYKGKSFTLQVFTKNEIIAKYDQFKSAFLFIK